MKENEKVIKIDPVLFTFSDNNKTKKKEKKPKKANIKIKTKEQKKKDTLKKQSLLKMIRHHQEDKYKQLFEKKNKKKIENMIKDNEETFKDSFQTSKDYLSSLISSENATIPQSQPKRNVTIKNNTIHQEKEPLIIDTTVSNVPLSIDLTNIGKETITSNNNNIQVPEINRNVEEVNIHHNNELPSADIYIPEPPKYGVLKNGTLPTYRNYFNKTRKGGENIINHNIHRKKIENKKKYSEIYKKNKRKRTIRRTYTTGKSLKVPKISVLVSNKTIRNKTSLNISKMKEVSIPEIKKELINRGLIRVGTIAPNDVLRKMYETVKLFCGDVQNYNTDTLLYNFMNQN